MLIKVGAEDFNISEMEQFPIMTKFRNNDKDSTLGVICQSILRSWLLSR